MADIPANLELDQILVPSYSNHPRLAADATYDHVLKAFILPSFALAAEKAKKEVTKKTTPAKRRPKKATAEGSCEEPVVAEAPIIFDGDGEKKFLCEKAKSGISRCRKCGQSIAKESLRFGYGSPDPRGEYGAIPIWFHMRCAPLGFIGFERFDDVLASLCFGFSSLSADEKKEVMDTAGKGMIVSKLLNEEDAEYAEEFEDVPLSDRLVHRRGVSVPLLAQPGEITGARLLPFQLEGYSWMVAQESNTATRGGILADEMGMGKTLQTISVIVSKREEVRPTLVVCPVAAVMQWYSEIEKFAPNVLSVHVYHGSQKNSAKQLAEFDIVLTTYQTLENEYRKQANKAKVMCKYCKKMFLPGKLKFHLLYMCGPDAKRTAKQSLRDIKSKGATEKAKRTMGITGSGGEEPPTIANVLREVVKQSGLVKDEAILDRMSQYDLMRLYRSPGGERDDVDKVSDVAVEEAVDETGFLRKKTISELKNLLQESGITNFAAKSKKEDLIKLVIESNRGKENNRAKRKRDEAVILPPPSRRSAAVNALTVLKQEDESGDEDSDSGKKRPVKRLTEKKGRAKPHKKNQDSDSGSSWEDDDESIDVSSSETSESDDSSGYTSSASDGETVEVDSEDSEDELSDSFPKAATKKRTVVVGRKKKSEEDDLEEEDENAVEDIDLNNSPLHCVEWGRLVLDEAHRIKQRTNSTSLAAFALAAKYRWCLSGTPLQNRVGELYSLVRFLRFSPFAHYFCKGCDCKSLHFRFVDNRFCQKCGCARTKHYSYFKNVISGPIIKFGIGDGTALNILKTQVLDTILLRRTKLERQADLNLPSISTEVRKTTLSVEERDFYESLYKQSMVQFDTYAKSGTLLHNYAHIFDLLTRLRQALDHPYLIVFGADYTVPTTTTSSGGTSPPAYIVEVCALCQDDIGETEQKAIAKCSHKFHADCVREYLKEAPVLSSGESGCPACYAPLTLVFEDVSSSMPTSQDEEEKPAVIVNPKKNNSILERVGGTSKFQSSTKIEAVVDEVLKVQNTENSKCLIFSQFTRMLDLIEFRIKQNGVGCAKLTGSMTLTQRSGIIQAFNSDSTMRALLISLKAGGEGLNLQVADHVFLVDPWWNPASELQAIQRAHRIGQTKPVKAIRFVTEKSVEEKVVALQEMKQLVFDATVGQSHVAEKKLDESDLRFLFQH